jgi:hypothetical protein
MRFRGWRSRTVTTLAGPVTVWRPYWHCAGCGTGVHPADQQWALPSDGASLAVQTQAALLGILQPFRHAADMLQRLTGVSVSARSIETWTERMGTLYTPPVLGAYEPGPMPDVLVLATDAVMTCFHDGWHEEKVAMAWTLQAGEAQPPRYVTAEGTWEDFESSLLTLARREGSRRARAVVCLADGAHPIWRVLSRCFPDAFPLVDWYHVQEHLAVVATAHGNAGAAWHAAQREALRTRGPVPTLWALRRLSHTGETPAVRAAARACWKYLWWHRTRLDYPTALERGYPIGSGRIESGCKQIVQQRVKLAGMRWSHPHVQAVLAARCAFFSSDWDLACTQYQQAA